MAKERSNEEQPSFWVVVEDHHTKVFSVFGPLAGDSEWTTRVRAARQRGRNVTVSTVASELDAKTMTRNLRTHGFTEGQILL